MHFALSNLKENIIIGVNQFKDNENIPNDLLQIDEEKTSLQIKHIKSIKKTRNNDQVNNQLQNLKDYPLPNLY